MEQYHTPNTNMAQLAYILINRQCEWHRRELRHLCAYQFPCTGIKGSWSVTTLELVANGIYIA